MPFEPWGSLIPLIACPLLYGIAGGIDNYRAVILLYEAHSLTAAEIASLLGLKVTTVKMRLHRARRMLLQVMECGCALSTDDKGVPVCQPKAKP